VKPNLVPFGVCLLVVGAACAKDDEVVVDPVVVGMTNKLAPTYDDGQTRIYQVSVPVRLPIRRPTDAESNALGAAPPFPHAPFLSARDFQIEIRFTLSNLDDQPHSVELLIDPWNEFVRYRPGIQVVNDEAAVPDLSGFDKFFVVPGKSRTTGIVSPDDGIELATDLATAEAILAAPPAGANVNGMINHLFNLQNRSSVYDPLISSFIPKVIPAMIGFDLGLRSYEQGNLAVEVVVDVSDMNGNRVLQPNETGNDDGNVIDAPQDQLVPPKG